MSFDYSPRECVPLLADTPVEHPEDLPELVHYADPAMLVFTDFTRVRPQMTVTGMPVNEALEKMKNGGVRLLVVVDEKQHVIGLVTASRIMGDAPIRIAEDRRIDRSAITVGMIMTRLEDVRVLEMNHLRDAKVGHIVATLHQLEQRHVLVTDGGMVRGLFSASQISKQLGHDIMNQEVAAHTLSEMVHSIG